MGADGFEPLIACVDGANSAIGENENLIAKFKREHLAPGEMEKISIPKVLLDKITTGSATVSVEEG